MPQLTNQQLLKIQDKLITDYDFYYDDSKYEIIDHMASEIESMLHNTTFESAFDTVFKNWNSQLKETEWDGKFLYGSFKIPFFYKIKMNKVFKTDTIIWLFLSVFFTAIFYSIQYFFDVETLNFISKSYRIAICLLVIALNIITTKAIAKSNFTTVFGRISTFKNANLLPALILLSFYFTYFLTIKRIEQYDKTSVFILFFNLFYFAILVKHCNYFRHLFTINRIKKWNSV